MTRRRLIIGGVIIAVLLVIFLTPVPTIAYILYLNTFTTTTEFEVRDDKLWMNSTINSKTYDQFVAVLEENPQIISVVLAVVPGSLDDETNLRLAYFLREKGLNTHLLANSEIDSGGVDLFLAGVERTMERGAHIGVHSWSDGVREATSFPRDAPEHEPYLKYYRDMLIDDEFYWFTLSAAPADGIHEMTEDEIEQYGMLTQPISN